MRARLQVLHYKLYTVEAVPGCDVEPARTRVYELTYYTADCTAKLVEPVVTNSGLPQVRQ